MLTTETVQQKIEIKIREEDGKFFAQVNENDRPPYSIYNPVAAERHSSGTLKNPNGLRIKFDANEGKMVYEEGVIPNSDLTTRFELKYEGERSNILEIHIEESSTIADGSVHVLKLLGSTDYRARIGGREQPFYFIIENCYASIHVEETIVNDRKLYYLVIRNKSMR